MNRLKESYSGCMNCGGKMKMKSGGNWIKGAIKKPGSFTAQANKAGMSVPAFRNKVLSNKSAYSATTVKRANLAKTLAGMRKGEDGLLNSKKSFTDPMVADAGVNQSVSMVAGNTINRQEQNEMMSVAPRVRAVDPLNLAANTDLNKSIGQPLSPERQKVKSYQEMLRSKGYDIAADGAWGPKTQKAYEAYIKSKTTSTNSASQVPAASKSVVPGTQKINPAFKGAASNPYMRTNNAGNSGYTDNTRVGNFNPVSRKTADLAEYARKVGYIRQTPGKKVYPTTKG